MKFVSLSLILGRPLFGSNSGLFIAPGFILSPVGKGGKKRKEKEKVNEGKGNRKGKEGRKEGRRNIKRLEERKKKIF